MAWRLDSNDFVRVISNLNLDKLILTRKSRDHLAAIIKRESSYKGIGETCIPTKCPAVLQNKCLSWERMRALEQLLRSISVSSLFVAFLVFATLPGGTVPNREFSVVQVAVTPQTTISAIGKVTDAAVVCISQSVKRVHSHHCLTRDQFSC